jgi:hypothetical protein
MDQIYTEEYKGLTINIIHDTDVQNPFEDWDCNPPIAVNSAYNRSIDEYATQYGNVNSVPFLSEDQIIANADALRELVGAWELNMDGDSVEDQVNEHIGEYIEYSCSDRERLEALCELYNMAGQPALLKSVHGSCQGDYAEVLAVATPEFQKACGNDEGFWNDPQSLAPSIQLFEDWAFGNVYGYQVEDAEGEDVDSCWGFYGDYDGEYSALSEAKSAVDSHVAHQQKQHIEQVKTWIKNRVPFQYRMEAA